MTQDQVLKNRAIAVKNNTVTKQDDMTGCELCNEELIFALEDSFHQFSIGLRTILQCLNIAEKNGNIPQLPEDWWIEVMNRHQIDEQDFLTPQRE